MTSVRDPWSLLQVSERSLSAGETLFAAGDATRGFFLVRSGRIRLVRFGSGGRETLLHTVQLGGRFAEASLFAETYHCNAVAVVDSIVACVPKAAALALLDNDADAARALVAELAREVIELRAMLTLRDVRSARERVLAYLGMRAGVDGRTVAASGHLKDIAAAIGLTPEVFYRTLAGLEADGVIRRGPNMIEMT